MEVIGFGGKTPKLKHPSHPIISRTHAFALTSIGTDLDHLAEMSVRSLHCSYSFPFHTVLHDRRPLKVGTIPSLALFQTNCTKAGLKGGRRRGELSNQVPVSRSDLIM